jgi:hypothetical protein
LNCVSTNTANIGIDAIAQRNVHDPILSSEWNSGFGAMTGQREKSFTLTAAENQS